MTPLDHGARWRLVALALALHGCARGCHEARTPPEPTPTASRHEASTGPVDASEGASRVPSRCVPEITRAAVATPLGTGPIDTLTAACAGERLAVFALRGHVLSRMERELTPGATFSAPAEVSTGADRLGPVAPRGVEGPVAWRSPTAEVNEDTARDEVWVGLTGSPPRRGSVLLPSPLEGLGTPFAIGADARRVSVLAGFTRPGEPPWAMLRRIVTVRDDRETLTAAPPRALTGELLAWEFDRSVALVRSDAGLTAWRVEGGALREVGSVPLARSQVMVAPRGARVGEASVFVAGDFDVRGPDAGPCVRLGAGLCVAPGEMFLVRVDERAVTRVNLGAGLMPDAITAEGTRAVVLHVDLGGAGGGQQGASRVEPSTGRRVALTLSPPEGFPAIDRPGLVSCVDGPWLVAEVSLPAGDEEGEHAAVTALPLECLAR